MKLTCTTQPTVTPVSLEEVKSFCRVLTNDDDAILTILINAATDYAQSVTGRQLCSATYELIASYTTSPLIIPRAPLKAITSVEYKDVNGVWQPLDYTLNWDYDVGIVEFSATSDVRIIFTCGYDTIPASLKAWALNKVSSLFEFRESIIVGSTVSEVPKSMIDCALTSYKVRFL
jgi:uncharacterized phiE125 gp8 family phage protein